MLSLFLLSAGKGGAFGQDSAEYITSIYNLGESQHLLQETASLAREIDKDARRQRRGGRIYDWREAPYDPLGALPLARTGSAEIHSDIKRITEKLIAARPKFKKAHRKVLEDGNVAEIYDRVLQRHAAQLDKLDAALKSLRVT